jgi:predicted kinase
MFIQMSGAPGSGKTTLAHAIAHPIRAVVIDHDVTKSALLDADVPATLAGHASYQVLNAIARHLLHQGHSVVFDSPCFYIELLERGQQLAQEAQVPYRYIECVVEDLDELDRRLRTRPQLPSQLTGVYVLPSAGSGKIQSGEAIFRDWIANMKRPTANYLVLDTTRPLDVCLKTALAYIRNGVGNR